KSISPHGSHLQEQSANVSVTWGCLGWARTKRKFTLATCPLLQEALALPQRPLAILQRALVGPVLDLDAHRTRIPHIGQRCEEGTPLHLAQPRQLGHVPAQPEDASLVQAIAVDALVLGVDVDDAAAELADGPGDVDELPDQVRRIEVQPQ